MPCSHVWNYDMACIKREKTGSCTHFICELNIETRHGYECVDIYPLTDGTGRWVCEVGEDCHTNCQYSFKKGEIPVDDIDLGYSDLF